VEGRPRLSTQHQHHDGRVEPSGAVFEARVHPTERTPLAATTHMLWLQLGHIFSRRRFSENDHGSMNFSTNSF
jgi:hypothetical protein